MPSNLFTSDKKKQRSVHRTKRKDARVAAPCPRQAKRAQLAVCEAGRGARIHGVYLWTIARWNSNANALSHIHAHCLFTHLPPQLSVHLPILLSPLTLGCSLSR